MLLWVQRKFLKITPISLLGNAINGQRPGWTFYVLGTPWYALINGKIIEMEELAQNGLLHEVICTSSVQYRQDGGSRGKTPGTRPQGGPWKFCYCKIIFKKPFVGCSFVSSVRTSLLVRFVLILGAWFIMTFLGVSLTILWALIYINMEQFEDWITEYQCFIRVLNWLALFPAPSCLWAATPT